MKTQKLQQLAHLVAGLLLLAAAFDWFEKKDMAFSLNFLMVGCLFLAVAGAHKWVRKNFNNADIAMFLLGASAFLYSAWHYNEDGSAYLWIVTGIAGVAYLLFGIISIIASINNNRRHSRRSNRRKRRAEI
jgi:uncharacterized membrane protein HdeD (DUF308 family)